MNPCKLSVTIEVLLVETPTCDFSGACNGKNWTILYATKVTRFDQLKKNDDFERS